MQPLVIRYVLTKPLIGCQEWRCSRAQSPGSPARSRSIHPHTLQVTMAPLATTITSFEVAQLLARYSGAIAGAARPNAKLEAVSTLDDWRRTELPGTLASRSPPHMTKAELYRLVDCKLYPHLPLPRVDVQPS